MKRALYRKYRSKTLDEVMGQGHITSTLKRALEQNRISHAYLLTGPKGVGKTSVARIIAHQVNSLAYEDDAPHIDIIEIDAASNRRIDEIRDLRDKVHVAPAFAKYKVYIVDEVHMLTKEAFNALLKTLEEPPTHVIFILATTDLHKLPDTIVSRCIHFHFRPIAETEIARHLKKIAASENIAIEDNALRLIAAHSDGSFRDSLSLLDQIASQADKITMQDVETLLGIAPKHQLDSLYADLLAGDTGAILNHIQLLIEQGLPPANIAKQIAERVRENITATDNLAQAQKISLLQSLLGVPSSSDPRISLEIALIGSIHTPQPEIITRPDSRKNLSGFKSSRGAPEVVLHDAEVGTNDKKAAIQQLNAPGESGAEDTLRRPSKASDDDKPQVDKQATGPKEVSAKIQPAMNHDAEKKTTSLTFSDNVWKDLLKLVQKKHNTLYGVLRMANPSVDGDTLRLAFAYAFHQKKIDDTKNKQIISKLATDLCGAPLQIECIVDPSLKDVPPPDMKLSKETAGPGNNAVKSVSDIFGGAEVLE